ncbi:hypothetical protein RJ639_006294 [Escallonia herrerae]|uniref:Uncharacterized protein n=1 Tax=Escallonia herrerae TaxID=1293975 RepID=A0AA88VVU5_9ASTE|nr:hypothetical protein RJ639_006294 [Escallonia herrerae]
MRDFVIVATVFLLSLDLSPPNPSRHPSNCPIHQAPPPFGFATLPAIAPAAALPPAAAAVAAAVPIAATACCCRRFLPAASGPNFCPFTTLGRSRFIINLVPLRTWKPPTVQSAANSRGPESGAAGYKRNVSLTTAWRWILPHLRIPLELPYVDYQAGASFDIITSYIAVVHGLPGS